MINRCRRYGGTNLGPARFTHIETCASEVCKEFKRSEEIQDCITTLRTLDDLLTVHRDKLASFASKEPTSESSKPTVDYPSPNSTPHKAKKPDYDGLDLTKAKRLIQARENALKSVKSLIQKKVSPL